MYEYVHTASSVHYRRKLCPSNSTPGPHETESEAKKSPNDIYHCYSVTTQAHWQEIPSRLQVLPHFHIFILIFILIFIFGAMEKEGVSKNSLYDAAEAV